MCARCDAATKKYGKDSEVTAALERHIHGPQGPDPKPRKDSRDPGTAEGSKRYG